MVLPVSRMLFLFLLHVLLSLYVFFLYLGGYTVGSKPLIELLRQRSRPYLFSNSLPPPVVACATRAVDLLMASSEIAQSMTSKTMRYGVQGFFLLFFVCFKKNACKKG